MDRNAAILASLPGLERRLRRAGVDKWLEEQPSLEIGGERYFIVGGDRRATKAEAMLNFAVEKGLVTPTDVEAASDRQPLEPDVEAVEIGNEEQGGL